ncbi:MAG TPA: YoaK family protein [Solirubrobacteraceae bacterium]|nr:YoaK family protein [Solirubrobacteraceae bacterium]
MHGPGDGAQAAPSRTVRLSDALPRALLALTFTTGLIDAASYLGLGHVFSANMTGNVVLLGFGIAGAGGLPIVSPLIAAATFGFGAGLGGVAIRRVQAPTRAFVFVVAFEACVLAAAALLAVVANVRPNAAYGDTIVALLALAMGARNASVRRLGVPDLSTTVLTMTLTGLTADSRVAGGSGSGTPRRVAAICAMLAGAIAGALMLRTTLILPLALAAALALLTCLAYARTRGAFRS